MEPIAGSSITPVGRQHPTRHPDIGERVFLIKRTRGRLPLPARTARLVLHARWEQSPDLSRTKHCEAALASVSSARVRIPRLVACAAARIAAAVEAVTLARPDCRIEESRASHDGDAVERHSFLILTGKTLAVSIDQSRNGRVGRTPVRCRLAAAAPFAEEELPIRTASWCRRFPIAGS